MYNAPARQRTQQFLTLHPKAMVKPKLFDRVHSVARLRHLLLGTERAYADWIRRFILFRHKRHPAEMGVEEIRLSLSRLGVGGRVAASTQDVAVCALLFLYRDVLRVELPYVEGIFRSFRAIRTCGRRWSTRTCWIRVVGASGARWRDELWGAPETSFPRG